MLSFRQFGNKYFSAIQVLGYVEYDPLERIVFGDIVSDSDAEWRQGGRVRSSAFIIEPTRSAAANQTSRSALFRDTLYSRSDRILDSDWRIYWNKTIREKESDPFRYALQFFKIVICFDRHLSQRMKFGFQKSKLLCKLILKLKKATYRPE